MKGRSIAAALVLTVFVGGCESLDELGESREDVVTLQLDAMGSYFTNSGWRRGDGQPRHIDAMRNGAEQTIRLDLRGGAEYVFIGACDQDCRDLNLHLVNAQGAEVASDAAPGDDTPIVTYTPSRAGAYRLRAVMARCNVSPCAYGVQTLSR